MYASPERDALVRLLQGIAAKKLGLQLAGAPTLSDLGVSATLSGLHALGSAQCSMHHAACCKRVEHRPLLIAQEA